MRICLRETGSLISISCCKPGGRSRSCPQTAQRWRPKLFFRGSSWHFSLHSTFLLSLLPRQLDFRRLLDDFLKQLSRNSALRRPMRFPDLGGFLGQNIGEITAAFYALGGKIDDVDFARPLVAMLDQQPRA